MQSGVAMSSLSLSKNQQLERMAEKQSLLCALLIAFGVFLIFAVLLTQPRGENAIAASTIVNWCYTVITAVLVFVVFTQVRAASKASRDSIDHDREQRRLWATLQARDRYDIDPELTKAIQRLRKYHWYMGPCLLPPGVTGITSPIATSIRVEKRPSSFGAELTSDQEYTLAVGKLLNYFDSIAIGMIQGFYVEEVCRDHIGGIFMSWIDDLRAVDPNCFDKQMAKNFDRLPVLYNYWGGPWR
jgi:hypothetical protein